MATILSENVASQIRHKVISGQYAIGEKIPNENQIATILKVSRNTVREAVKILVTQNVLEIRRGHGTFVCQCPGVSDDPFGMSFFENDDLLKCLIEARKLFEPEFAALAAVRATEEELTELLDDVNKLHEQVDQFDHLKVNNKTIEAVLNLDMKFHHTIAKLSHNPIFERLAPIILNHLFETYSLDNVREFQKNFVGNRRHFEIYQAIRNREPDKAKALCYEHIVDSPWLNGKAHKKEADI